MSRNLSRWQLWSLLLLPVFAHNVWAKAEIDPAKLIFKPVPTWVDYKSTPKASNADELMDIQYLLFSKQVNLALDKKVNYSRLSQKVRSQQGLSSAAKLEIDFVPAYQQIVLHKIEVERDGKILDRINVDNIKLFQLESELEQGMYQETWQALVILDDIRVGDVVSYAYSIEGSNPVLGDKHFGFASLDWSVPLVNFHFNLIVPSDEFLQYKLENSTAKVIDTSKNGLRNITISQQQVPAVHLEDGYPSWFNPYGLFEYSQYENWQQLNQWAMALYPATAKLPDELKQLLAEQEFATKLDAVTFVTQWVQDNVRYFGIETGINSHKPSLPSETLTRRYGDCKDKTVLLNAALRHLDIAAVPALVSTLETQSLTKRLPSPGAFNHVISYFELQGKPYWVDATMSGQKGPINTNSFPDLAWGFVVKPESRELTPMEPVSLAQVTAKVDIEETISVDSQGQTTLTVKNQYTGWRANQLRSYISSVGAVAATKSFSDYYSGYFEQVEAKEPLKVSELGDNRLQIEANYVINELRQSQTNADQVILYASAIISELQPAKVKQRKYPFALSDHLQINHRLNVVPHQVSDVLWWGELKPFKLNSPWFNYSMNAVKQKNGLAIDFSYHSLTDQVKAKDYGKYMDKLDEIDPQLVYSLMMRKGEQKRQSQRDKNVRSLLNKLMNKQ